MDLKFDDFGYEMADLDEISKDVLAEQEQNVFDTENIDTELTNRAHIVNADGEIVSLED